MEAKKIDKNKILTLIAEEAKVIKRKKELYEEVKKINEELKSLNECGLTGAFGFMGDKGAGNPSGFEMPQNISHIAQLEKDMAMEEPFEETGLNNDMSLEENETEKAKKENEEMIKQMEAMKKQIEDFLKIQSNLNENKK